MRSNLSLAIQLFFMLACLLFLGSSCASGPICTGTDEEVLQCQQRMERARSNFFYNQGNRR